MIFHDHEISFCHADKELEKYLKERWIFLQKSAGATVNEQSPVSSSSPSTLLTAGYRPVDERVFLHLSRVSTTVLYCLRKFGVKCCGPCD